MVRTAHVLAGVPLIGAVLVLIVAAGVAAAPGVPTGGAPPAVALPAATAAAVTPPVAAAPIATTSPAATAVTRTPAAAVAPNATASLAAATASGMLAAATERITLDQAIQRALRRNPSAAVAALELDRAEALVRQARATSFPSLTGNATYTRLDHERGFAGRTFAARDQLNANLVLSVPLIAPGKWVQWSHSRDDAKVLGLSSDETRRQLAISVARTFLTVVSQHRAVEVNERAFETARAHDRYAAERLAGGVGKRIDAVRASQQVSTNQVALQRSRAALMSSMEALGVLLGEERQIDVAVDPELGTIPNAATAVMGSENRLDVHVARAKREAAERKFRDSWVDFLPQLTGQFQPFYQSPATLTMPSTGWQAMLMLTVPLYDGGARYGANDERRILREQAQLQVDGLLRQARSEVRIAFESQRMAETALASARSAADLAHQAQQMATLAYEAGASTNIEVIDAERQARDADNDVAVAEDALRQARLDLLIASGRFPSKK
jgi:outer membrane protein